MRAIEIAKESDKFFRRLIGEAIVNRLGVPARRHDFFRSKLGKMLGESALAQIHEATDFSDRFLPVAQSTENRQSLLAREKLQKMGGVARTRLKRFDRNRRRAARPRSGARGWFSFRTHPGTFVYSTVYVNREFACRERWSVFQDDGDAG